MKKRVFSAIIALACLLSLCSCKTNSSIKSNSTFSIQFIDVGQGDAALVECDGHYMLIDGGDRSAGDKVYNVLQENGIMSLDILAISHLHEDHYGGLIKALSFATDIGITICNKSQIDDYTDSDDSENNVASTFRKLESELGTNGTHIIVPQGGTKYSLGSADVEIINISSGNDNDSLVLLITYGKNSFLFTGDIEETAQKRLSESFSDRYSEKNRLSLIKMPHHGGYSSTTYQLLNTFLPEYAVISVGAGNQYNHPSDDTISKLDDLNRSQGVTVYRTDLDGDITVRSNGKTLSIETSK